MSPAGGSVAVTDSRKLSKISCGFVPAAFCMAITTQVATATATTMARTGNMVIRAMARMGKKKQRPFRKLHNCLLAACAKQAARLGRQSDCSFYS